MLILSIIGPAGTGTVRRDLHSDGWLPGAAATRFMDRISFLDQQQVVLTAPDWQLMMLSRGQVTAGSPVMQWIGLYSNSPVSPDGRTGFYLGLGAFFTGRLIDPDTAFAILYGLFQRYFGFVQQSDPRSFSVTQMRLDRIGSSLDEMGNLAACIDEQAPWNGAPLGNEFRFDKVSESFLSADQFCMLVERAAKGSATHLLVSDSPGVFASSRTGKREAWEPTGLAGGARPGSTAELDLVGLREDCVREATKAARDEFDNFQREVTSALSLQTEKISLLKRENAKLGGEITRLQGLPDKDPPDNPENGVSGENNGSINHTPRGSTLMNVVWTISCMIIIIVTLFLAARNLELGARIPSIVDGVRSLLSCQSPSIIWAKYRNGEESGRGPRISIPYSHSATDRVMDWWYTRQLVEDFLESSNDGGE
jgi:hypothetical protein